MLFPTRYATLAVTGDNLIHEHDYVYILSQIAHNPAGREIVWNLLDSSWDNVYAASFLSKYLGTTISSLYKYWGHAIKIANLFFSCAELFSSVHLFQNHNVYEILYHENSCDRSVTYTSTLTS